MCRRISCGVKARPRRLYRPCRRNSSHPFQGKYAQEGKRSGRLLAAANGMPYGGASVGRPGKRGVGHLLRRDLTSGFWT